MTELETRAFADAEALWAWLAKHAVKHPGLWVRVAKSGSGFASVAFHELLEAGIAYGWSESTRRTGDATTYLQKFTPRRSRGTASARKLEIARQLERDGRMTDAGRAALGM